MEKTINEQIVDEDLISEDFSIDGALIAEEEIRDGKKSICFRGVFSEADKMNRNHRIYPKHILKEAFENAWNESVASGQPIYGELEHSSDAKCHLERIAVTFPELSWNEEKGQIVGKAIPTLTEAGQTVEKLAKSGFKICFSTRCSGKVKPYHGPLAEGVNNAVEVQPGLKIISIDVVGTPSCQKAVTNTVYEGFEEPVRKGRTFKEIFDAEF